MKVQQVTFIECGLIVGVIDHNTWVIANELALYYDEDDCQCVNEEEPYCIVEVDPNQHELEYVSVEDETALAQFFDRPIIQIQGDELDIAIDVRTMKKLQYDADKFNQFCESL